MTYQVILLKRVGMYKRPKICMKISAALELLDPKLSAELMAELKTYPSTYWLVEGDIPKEDGSPHLLILEDTAENNRILLQHKPVDLNT